MGAATTGDAEEVGHATFAVKFSADDARTVAKDLLQNSIVASTFHLDKPQRGAFDVEKTCKALTRAYDAENFTKQADRNPALLMVLLAADKNNVPVPAIMAG